MSLRPELPSRRSAPICAPGCDVAGNESDPARHELRSVAWFALAGAAAGVLVWGSLAQDNSVRPWLVITLAVASAVLVGIVWQLWRLQYASPEHAPLEHASAVARTRTDRERGGVQRVERTIEVALADADRFNGRVRPWLIELAEHRLRRRYAVDLRSDPDRARELLGDSLWQMTATPRKTPPSRQELTAWVARIEAL